MQATADPLPIDLALQGGGSHGAFTWGVLDRLLEEERLRIVAISGTSAGAMNAAVLADGWAEGGAAGARAALRAYWQEVSRAAALSPLQRSPLDRMMGRWTLDTSPAYIAMDLMSRLLSPYDLNPLAYNPLRKILVKCIDFERLARSPIKLFVTREQRAPPSASYWKEPSQSQCAGASIAAVGLVAKSHGADPTRIGPSSRTYHALRIRSGALNPAWFLLQSSTLIGAMFRFRAFHAAVVPPAISAHASALRPAPSRSPPQFSACGLARNPVAMDSGFAACSRAPE